MNIREFAKGDTKAVIELWGACGLTRPWNDPEKDIARKLSVQPELFWWESYMGHRGSIFYLAVSPDYQRLGYGKLLMKKVEELLLAMDCPKLNILVRTSNDKVLAFYNNLGYKTDDVVSLGKRLIPDV